jgi:hypothetical protein
MTNEESNDDDDDDDNNNNEVLQGEDVSPTGNSKFVKGKVFLLQV